MGRLPDRGSKETGAKDLRKERALEGWTGREEEQGGRGQGREGLGGKRNRPKLHRQRQQSNANPKDRVSIVSTRACTATSKLQTYQVPKGQGCV